VTVITPTHMRPYLLRRAIKSVIDQTFQQWELMVVSDGDESAKIIFDEFTGDPRLYFILLPCEYRDWGVTPRNIGVILAHANLICYLDDDNEYLPSHIQDLYDLINKTGAGFVYGSTELRNQSQPDISLGNRQNPTPPRYGYIDTSEIMHRLSLIEKCGLWPRAAVTDAYPWGKPTGKYGDDWAMVEKWLNAGISWAHSPNVSMIYFYRR